MPTRESTNVLAACLSCALKGPVDPEKSSTRPTRRPHVMGSTGLTRESCQIPPEAFRSVAPVPSMNPLPPVVVEEYVCPPWRPGEVGSGTWKEYGVA